MVKTRSIATKVALVVSAVVIGALALTGWFALKRSDAELVQLQLHQASQQLTTNLGIAQRIFEERFPGPWRLAAAAPRTFDAGPSSPPESLGYAAVQGRRAHPRQPGGVGAPRGAVAPDGHPAQHRAAGERRARASPRHQRHGDPDGGAALP